MIIMVLLFCCVARLGFAAPYEEIIAFGDSLSDVGNTATVATAGYEPKIPGYYEESHYSDNQIWVELLAEYWNLPARTLGNVSQPDGNTWAWGGAEAASGTVSPPGVTVPIPNLLTQIDQYLESNTPDDRTLYSILSGADNLLIGQKFSPSAAKAAVTSIASAITRLSQAGATHFLIFSLPRLGDTPFAEHNVAAKVAANIYTDSFNHELKKVLAALHKDRTFTAKIYFVDLYKEIELVLSTVKHDGSYVPGFFVPGQAITITNVKERALDYFNSYGSFPTNYMFWDSVHPTTQAHQVVAGLVLEAVNTQHVKRKHKKALPAARR